MITAIMLITEDIKKIEVFNGQATCPNCKYIFGGIDVIKNLIMWHMPYCKDCGQKLDWSDEDEVD